MSLQNNFQFVMEAVKGLLNKKADKAELKKFVEKEKFSTEMNKKLNRSEVVTEVSVGGKNSETKIAVTSDVTDYHSIYGGLEPGTVIYLQETVNGKSSIVPYIYVEQVKEGATLLRARPTKKIPFETEDKERSEGYLTSNINSYCEEFTSRFSSEVQDRLGAWGGHIEDERIVYNEETGEEEVDFQSWKSVDCFIPSYEEMTEAWKEPLTKIFGENYISYLAGNAVDDDLPRNMDSDSYYTWHYSWEADGRIWYRDYNGNNTYKVGAPERWWDWEDREDEEYADIHKEYYVLPAIFVDDYLKFSYDLTGDLSVRGIDRSFYLQVNTPSGWVGATIEDKFFEPYATKESLSEEETQRKEADQKLKDTTLKGGMYDNFPMYGINEQGFDLPIEDTQKILEEVSKDQYARDIDNITDKSGKYDFDLNKIYYVKNNKGGYDRYQLDREKFTSREIDKFVKATFTLDEDTDDYTNVSKGDIIKIRPKLTNYPSTEVFAQYYTDEIESESYTYSSYSYTSRYALYKGVKRPIVFYPVKGANLKKDPRRYFNSLTSYANSVGISCRRGQEIYLKIENIVQNTLNGANNRVEIYATLVYPEEYAWIKLGEDYLTDIPELDFYEDFNNNSYSNENITALSYIEKFKNSEHTYDEGEEKYPLTYETLQEAARFRIGVKTSISKKITIGGWVKPREDDSVLNLFYTATKNNSTITNGLLQSFDDTDWHHCVCILTISTGEYELFVDGELKKRSSVYKYPAVPGEEFYIDFTGGDQSMVPVAMKGIFYAGHELSEQEIKALYNYNGSIDNGRWINTETTPVGEISTISNREGNFNIKDSEARKQLSQLIPQSEATQIEQTDKITITSANGAVSITYADLLNQIKNDINT